MDDKISRAIFLRLTSIFIKPINKPILQDIACVQIYYFGQTNFNLNIVIVAKAKGGSSVRRLGRGRIIRSTSKLSNASFMWKAYSEKNEDYLRSPLEKQAGAGRSSWLGGTSSQTPEKSFHRQISVWGESTFLDILLRGPNWIVQIVSHESLNHFKLSHTGCFKG